MALAPSSAAALHNDQADSLGLWGRFWFKAADPTTLGFMRILVGALVLYTHIIYSFDLHEFFGKDGWYHVDSMNKRRHEQPWVFPTNDFPSDKLMEDPYKPYEFAPANRPITSFEEKHALDQLMRVVDVLPWESDKERRQFEGVTSDEAKLSHLNLLYYKFWDEYNLEVRSLLDKDGKLLPAKEREEIMEFSKLHGVDPRKVDMKGVALFSIWFHVTDPDWMIVVHVGILCIMVLFTLGVATPITSVLTWLAAVSYIHRAPTALFGQDTMMNILLLYLMIGNLIPGRGGAALSVDRLIARWWARRLGRERDFPSRPQPTVLANVAYRLVQIHICFIYFVAGTSKLQGSTWWTGTAIWWTTANYEFAPLNREIYRKFLFFLTHHRWLWEIMMTGGVVHTFLVELGFPFLAWNRRLRWFMVTVATLLHAGIALFMGLTLFQIFMLIFLLPFYPPETMQRLVDSIRDTIRAILPAQASQSPAPAPATSGA